MDLIEYKKVQYPFEEYLREIHARDYMGTDDEMSDSFDNFLGNLEGEGYIEHGNAFTKMLLDQIPVNDTLVEAVKESEIKFNLELLKLKASVVALTDSVHNFEVSLSNTEYDHDLGRCTPDNCTLLKQWDGNEETI